VTAPAGRDGEPHPVPLRDRLLGSSSFRLAFDNAPVAMAILASVPGQPPTIQEANRALARVAGRSSGQLAGAALGGLLHPADRDRALAALRALTARRPDLGAGDKLDMRVLLDDRRTAQVSMSLTLLPSRSGFSGQLTCAFFEEVSARQQSEQQLSHQGMHDSLTGLPNRVLLVDRLRQALARDSRSDTMLAVLFIDLDNFKVVNDSLGHVAGDDLLVELADRLRRHLRQSDTAARLGGDEFVVIVEDCQGEAQACALVSRIASDLAMPCRIAETEVCVSASIGVALGQRGATAEELLRNADIAMYRAKHRGRNRMEIFDDELHAQAVTRLDTEVQLRNALADGQLRVLYQPILDLTDGRVDGVEALLRWEHPTRGLLLPAEFLEVAEQSGLIVPIGAWVLQTACHDAARWQADRADHPLTVAVNLSMRQLERGDFAHTLGAALAETSLDPAALNLEITESLFLEATMSTRTDLVAISAHGVGLGIDDFGTGYSSLLYLKRFPVSFLKVDRTFVAGLGSDAEDTAIVEAVVRLGQALGLDTIAEGVETMEQYDRLRRLNCNHVQGYYVAEPMTAAGVTHLLRAPARTPRRRARRMDGPVDAQYLG
jgi:diguanylate cyclase (GGDEF)-like protein